jgi:hypothetical protein
VACCSPAKKEQLESKKAETVKALSHPPEQRNAFRVAMCVCYPACFVNQRCPPAGITDAYGRCRRISTPFTAGLAPTWFMPMKMAASLVGLIAITVPNPDVPPFFRITG